MFAILEECAAFHSYSSSYCTDLEIKEWILDTGDIDMDMDMAMAMDMNMDMDRECFYEFRA